MLLLLLLQFYNRADYLGNTAMLVDILQPFHTEGYTPIVV